MFLADEYEERKMDETRPALCVPAPKNAKRKAPQQSISAFSGRNDRRRKKKRSRFLEKIWARKSIIELVEISGVYLSDL